MKIALHDSEYEHMPQKTFPNFALMKISAYHKSLGDTVEWWTALKDYDVVYSTKVFDFTPENPYLPSNTIKGGTGYDIFTKLPENIEKFAPDYSLYPKCDYASGFITRGCIRNCKWCIVPQKEGKISAYREVDEIIRPDSDKLILMDNNILALDFGISQLEKLIDSKYKIDINQGLDCRLVTAEIAEILAKLRWIKFIRFSCDTLKNVEYIVKSVELLKKFGVKPSKIFVYLLVTSDIGNAEKRVEILKKLGSITIYAQPERNEQLGIIPNKLQKEFAQRYIYGGSYRKETWGEYIKRTGLEKIYTTKSDICGICTTTSK
jgi:hypothetical protein